MTHRQETPETGTRRPQSAERLADGPADADARDRPPSAHAEPPHIRQLRAERDLLARTVAVYTRRTTADVLAETREALAGAAHINPRRDTAPWDQLAEQQRDTYRTEARRPINPTESN